MGEDDGGWAAMVMRMQEAAVSPRRVEMRRAAAALRRITEHLVATGAPREVLASAADALEGVAAGLEDHPRRRFFEAFAEAANSGDPHAFFDSSPLIGRTNPLAPPLDLRVVGGRVVGEARFGSAYEGPPGAVHGGFVAAAFDEVLGMAQSTSGQPGMTGTLTVRYLRPTPLHTEVRFDGELVRTEGRKIFTAGRVHAGAEPTAEAEAVFISVDFARMVESLRRREAGDVDRG